MGVRPMPHYSEEIFLSYCLHFILALQVKLPSLKREGCWFCDYQVKLRADSVDIFSVICL